MGYDDYVGDDDYEDYYKDLPQEDSSSLPIFVILGVVFLVLVGGGMVFFRFAGAMGHRRIGNESAAIGALKAISSAQSLHREGDKDNDGTLDYASSLQELGRGMLIDSVLASGQKQGYVFETHAGPEPQFMWFATADPEVPGETGMRFFYVDQSGVIYYSLDGPIQGPLDFNRLPRGVKLLGQ